MPKPVRKSHAALPDPAECQTVWFSRLEKARLDSDQNEAEAALQQLRRLGVEVRFTDRPHSRARLVNG